MSLSKNCVGHASGCGQRVFATPAEPLLPWREASWQGLFRLEHLVWAPYLLFPTAKECSVKTVHFGLIFHCRGRARGWASRRGLATQSIRMRRYGTWGCSIALSRVSAEVRVKVTAFLTDTISIRAACLL